MKCFFYVLENVLARMIDCRELDEELSQSFKLCFQSDNFVHLSVEKIVKDSSFITIFAAFVKQRVVNPVDEKLNRES